MPSCIDAADIIDMWEEGDGPQDNTFVKRKVSKVLMELLAAQREQAERLSESRTRAETRRRRSVAAATAGAAQGGGGAD